MTPVATVIDNLQRGARALRDLSDSPRLDAELLLGNVLGLSRAGLMARSDEPVAAERERAYDGLIDRRLQGAPVAYLTGTREFWSLPLTVTPAVLVPRPETELLVELALQRIPKRRAHALANRAAPAGPALLAHQIASADQALSAHQIRSTDPVGSVLDLGTGSGAIALAIAFERPGLRVTGVDISPAALEVAIQNSRDLGLTHIDWRLGSWFEAVSGEKFDVIVANPPYVAAADPALQILRAEPAIALNAGPTGLDALCVIACAAASHLNDSGWLLLEHGSDQAPDVARLLESQGFTEVRSQKDFSGKPRVTLGTFHSHH
jgi:release factor glutamine methyltransferase